MQRFCAANLKSRCCEASALSYLGIECMGSARPRMPLILGGPSRRIFRDGRRNQERSHLIVRYANTVHNYFSSSASTPSMRRPSLTGKVATPQSPSMKVMSESLTELRRLCRADTLIERL